MKPLCVALVLLAAGCAQHSPWLQRRGERSNRSLTFTRLKQQPVVITVREADSTEAKARAQTLFDALADMLRQLDARSNEDPAAGL